MIIELRSGNWGTAPFYTEVADRLQERIEDVRPILKHQDEIHRYVVALEVDQRVVLAKELKNAKKEIERLKKRLEK